MSKHKVDKTADQMDIMEDEEVTEENDSDFHSIKTLLKQLFSSDSELFELSELTELIVNQPSVGTTVKVDGSDSDPFAFLTVLNINEHKFLIITKVYKEVESMADKELEEENK
nr:5051_t:CDS:2 [Entrophospora candida]